MQVPFLDTKGIVPKDDARMGPQMVFIGFFFAIEHGNFLETAWLRYYPTFIILSLDAFIPLF
ncbi:hypothetical protein LguiB_001675 [Lonicera macranthoides]